MASVLQLGDPVKHFWMTRSVARAMGVSLSEAMAEGRLSASAYEKMVTQCRSCGRVRDCETWLGAQVCPATQAPECCKNAPFFDELKEA